MDLLAMWVSGVTLVRGHLVHLAYLAVRERSAVRYAELAQQGLSERIRSLPTGSTLTERSADRDVEIVVGSPSSSRGER
ncbi:hypothetical protein [Streptomyces sp. NPDC058657]|uniref:hypothetical protein n=1 Tax=unclassified Streptomyces TaxID=2593676 RepID=UPI0036562529